MLNTRTPQLISIVNALQDSFSSISQLVDAVALPDAPAPAPPTSGVGAADDKALRRDLQRLKLMIAAKGEFGSSGVDDSCADQGQSQQTRSSSSGRRSSLV